MAVVTLTFCLLPLTFVTITTQVIAMNLHTQFRFTSVAFAITLCAIGRVMLLPGSGEVSRPPIAAAASKPRAEFKATPVAAQVGEPVAQCESRQPKMVTAPIAVTGQAAQLFLVGTGVYHLARKAPEFIRGDLRAMVRSGKASACERSTILSCSLRTVA